jgi:hypothetical protein
MNLDSGSNTSQINNVGVDFIQEVKVQTSAFSAQYGRNSGGSINVVTKSGGDKFHGSLFETVRNDYLDAKDYFAPVKPPLRFNDFGWSFGGLEGQVLLLRRPGMEAHPALHQPFAPDPAHAGRNPRRLFGPAHRHHPFPRNHHPHSQ